MSVISITDPLCTKLWQRRAERFGLAVGDDTSEEVQIMVPAVVRRRPATATASVLYPFEAEGKVAGHRHLALGETRDRAVANLRDWIVGMSVPAGAYWALDMAEKIECTSADGCCGCIDNVIAQLKDALVVRP